MSFGDAATVVRAAESAKKAQEAWASIPAPIRGRAIAHIGRLIEDNAEALARLVTAEIGKPYAEALGEVREIIDTCDFFLGEGRRTVRADRAERDARQAAVHAFGVRSELSR